MASYFKNENVNKLEAHIFTMLSESLDPIFGKIGQRSRSHRHVMYTAKICLNSVPGGPINFILGC